MNGQTRFCQDGPNFVYFSIVDQDFLPKDQRLKITQNWKFQYWLQPRGKVLVLCDSAQKSDFAPSCFGDWSPSDNLLRLSHL